MIINTQNCTHMAVNGGVVVYCQHTEAQGHVTYSEVDVIGMEPEERPHVLYVHTRTWGWCTGIGGISGEDAGPTIAGCEGGGPPPPPEYEAMPEAPYAGFLAAIPVPIR